MPGLLDFAPNLLASKEAPTSGGLLSPEVLKLANGGLGVQPAKNPNETWDQKLFGTGMDDPRFHAMNAFIAALPRGGFPAAFGAYSNGYLQAQEALQRRTGDNLSQAKGALEIQSLVNAARRDQNINFGLDRLAKEEQGQVGRAAVAPMLDRSPSDQFGTPGFGGTPLFSMSAAGGLASPQAAGGQLGSSRGNYTQGLSNRFVRQAEVYAANGDFNTANKLYEQAAKWLPEVMKIEPAMHQGQPVNVITMKDGTQVVSQFNPTPKVHWADTGGQIQAVDEMTMRPLGGFAKGMTPDAMASNAVARDRLAFEKQQAGKPQLHEGQWVYPPSQGNPQGVAVAPTGLQPKPLTEFQGKSTSYAARMQDASGRLAELEGGTGGPPSPNQVAQAGYRAEFPNWLPGGQMLGGVATAANNALNPMVTDAAQRYRQAQENWVAAALRQESGAAIGKEEMEKYIRTFFPQPGDSEAVKAQKAAARKVSERAMLTQAGPGAQQIPSILGGERSGGAAPDWKYIDGKLVRVK